MAQRARIHSALIQHNNGSIDSRIALDDLPHTGRPPLVDMGFVKQFAQEHPRLTTWYLATRLGCSHNAVEMHLHEIGKVWKYRIWMPHELSPL